MTWHGRSCVCECIEGNACVTCRRSVQPAAEKKRQRYRPLTRPPVEMQNAEFELRLLEAAARRSQRTLKVWLWPPGLRLLVPSPCQDTLSSPPHSEKLKFQADMD